MSITFSRKQIIIIGIILATILLLIPIISIVNTKEYDAIQIKNSSSEAVSKISSDDINIFRHYLIHHLRQQNLISENDKINDAFIREDSVIISSTNSHHGDNTTISTFLIDIESVKQTYKISIINSTKELTDIPVKISCPKVSEMKYPDTECVGSNGDTSKKVIHHLPYETKLASNEKIIIKEFDKNYILQIYLFSCEDKNPPVDLAKSITQDWIKSIGDDSFYNLNIRTGYCEGDPI